MINKRDQPYQQNPLLRMSYTLLAPLYDLGAVYLFRHVRKLSLQSLPDDVPGEVLLSGVGTGLDLPLLPGVHRYTALDFNAAMLSRARPRRGELQVDWVLGDSMALPFADESFDHVVLHLIVAVVPDSELCLSEAARVLRPGGRIILLDKFLPPKKLALLRRALSLFTSRLVTRTDVVFEHVLRETPQLQVVSDVPLLAGGWFRGIVLQKK